MKNDPDPNGGGGGGLNGREIEGGGGPPKKLGVSLWMQVSLEVSH